MQSDFEAAAQPYQHRLPLDKGADGQYLDPHTNMAWVMWQAAAATPPADSLGASPAATAPAADAASAPIAGASLVGRRVQACDMGECEGATIMTDPQRGGSGDWQVLVLLDSRPDYLTPLGLNCVYLKEPS